MNVICRARISRHNRWPQRRGHGGGVSRYDSLPPAAAVHDGVEGWTVDRAVERHQQAVTNGGERLIAHHANMPKMQPRPNNIRSDGMESVNAFDHSGHHRAVHFRRLGLEIFGEAASNRILLSPSPMPSRADADTILGLVFG